MENTGGDASWLNKNNEIHNRSIHNMVREVPHENNQKSKNGAMQQRHQKKTTAEKYTVHLAIPHLNLHGMAKRLAFMNL